MKKVALLLSAVFMFGCGSGGGDGVTALSNGSGSPILNNSGSQPAKTFTLNLVDASKEVAKTTLATTPKAENVRVVISRYSTTVVQVPDLDGSGEPTGTSTPTNVYTLDYKDIQDVTYSDAVKIAVPVGVFTLDVITSKKEGTSNSTLKYGNLKGVDTSVVNATATVEMKSVDAILHMIVADNVTSKGKFNVTIDGFGPFVSNHKMTMDFNGQLYPSGSFTPELVTTSGLTSTFTAPASTQSGKTVSLTGQFALNPFFMFTTETAAQWTRIYPNSDYGESVSGLLSELVVVPLPGL